MTFPEPTVEEALLYVARNPQAVIPSTHPDEKRRDAAAWLCTKQYSVEIASTPQTATESLHVTLTKISGLERPLTQGFTRVQWPLLELATWCKLNDYRSNRQDLLNLGRALIKVLYGLQGTFAGLEIVNIVPEVEAFQQDAPPRDGSDRWISGYTYTYSVQHAATDFPSQRLAQGVDGP